MNRMVRWLATALVARIGALVLALPGALALALVGAAASAQAPGGAFPTKPLRLLVPFAAGGIADLSARAVAERMSRDLKQPIVIENTAGAGGVVAADLVAKADADGHTLLLMSNANAVSAGLFRKLPFDPARDFATVGLLGTFDLVIVAGAGTKADSLADLVAWTREHPDALNIGTINIGSTQHLAAELFKTTAGIRAQVVPFNGTPAVISALRGGQVDVAFEILGPMLPQIQSGPIHALAVTGERRSPALPNVPTVKENGVGNYVVTSWNALAVPAKTPAAIVARLNAALNAALADPAVAKRLSDLLVQPRPGPPAAAGQLLASETKRWAAVIARAGIPRE
jgi:tripartite-type tricarboxylate transporter receptor subunit TctC